MCTAKLKGLLDAEADYTPSRRTGHARLSCLVLKHAWGFDFFELAQRYLEVEVSR